MKLVEAEQAALGTASSQARQTSTLEAEAAAAFSAALWPSSACLRLACSASAEHGHTDPIRWDGGPHVGGDAGGDP